MWKAQRAAVTICGAVWNRSFQSRLRMPAIEKARHFPASPIPSNVTAPKGRQLSAYLSIISIYLVSSSSSWEFLSLFFFVGIFFSCLVLFGSALIFLSTYCCLEFGIKFLQQHEIDNLACTWSWSLTLNMAPYSSPKTTIPCISIYIHNMLHLECI